jgi:type I restriction enzyme M protein
MKAMRQDYKSAGIFYTPPALAEMLKQYAPLEPRDVYDPTCGQGNLLAAFGDDVRKFGQEIFAADLAAARERLQNFTGYVGDTLADDGFPGKLFHLVVANPPFSIKWQPNENDPRWSSAPCLPPPSKADYAFLLHILAHLADDGVAICLEFPGILYRGQREGRIREWMVRQNFIERVVHVPGNTFEDTSIATCILVLRKHRENTDVTFEDRENGLSRTVPFSEIAVNGFTLSVSSYISPPVDLSERPSAEELRASVQSLTLRSLETSIEAERMVCELENRPLQPFLDEIKAIVSKYE